MEVSYDIEDVEAEKERRIDFIRAVLASRSHYGFVKYTFGRNFSDNFHHHIISRELDEWIFSSEPYHLMVCCPPRHGKTEWCTRRLVPYILGRLPDSEIQAASYGADLITDHSRDIKIVMRSEAYHKVFPETRLAGPRERSENVSRITAFDVVGHRGKYRAAGVGGAFSGRGSHFGIIDDPLKGRKEAESKVVRQGVIDWYKAVFRTRLYQDGRILMPLTRWHHDDLAGWALKEMKINPDADRWRVVSFPAIYEKTEFSHPDDPRQDGEPLWPDRFDLNFLRKTKATLGQYDWNSLYQQRPDLPGGSVFKRYWAHEIERSQLPPGLFWVRYWDLAVSKKTKADYTASGRMAIDAEQNVYVSGFIHMQEEWPTVYRHFKAIANAEKIPVGVESQGTQKGFFQSMLEDKELANVAIMAYDESKDKLTRALPWIARAQAGKFFVVREGGMDEYLDELTMFTGADDDHDDQVDWTSGAYRMLQQVTQPRIQIVGQYG